MDDVEIRLLGPLEALHEGTALALGAPRERALLALLALNAARAVSASSLIDGLWGEAAPGSAAKMVQIHVSRLRKVLPPDVLVTRARGYELEVARGQVDAFRPRSSCFAAGTPSRRVTPGPHRSFSRMPSPCGAGRR